MPKLHAAALGVRGGEETVRVDGVEGRRRAPEKSVLLEAFRRGWASVSGCVPARVKQEAQRYLDCGQLRCGFVEVTCEAGSQSRLIAFSCKGRGWCPSCTEPPTARQRVSLHGLHRRAELRHRRQWLRAARGANQREIATVVSQFNGLCCHSFEGNRRAPHSWHRISPVSGVHPLI